MFFRYFVLSLMLCSFCHYEQWMVCRYCCRTYHLKGTNYSDRSSASAEHWIHFTATCNARLHWFLVGQISRNLNITRWSVSRWILSEQNFENFPVRGHSSKKTLNFRKNVQCLATSGRHNSEMITDRRKLTTKIALYRMSTGSFHFYCWNQLKVISLAFTVHTQRVPPPKTRLYNAYTTRITLNAVSRRGLMTSYYAI